METQARDTSQLTDEIAQASTWVGEVKNEIGKVLVGQDMLVDRLLLGLLCRGHVLLEGMPGLAKTLAVKSLAGSLKLGFARLQFTPDLLPADLIGTMIYNPDERSFTPKLGPIFSNIILADEINRAPAKVQSALLEAMQERQVTLGDTTYRLPAPFLVLATQNPIDQEGTYQLPEAQLDRFLLKVTVTYPSKSEELEIMDRMASTHPEEATTPIIDPEKVEDCSKLLDKIYIDGAVREYIVDIINATRHPERVDRSLHMLIRAGASPRGTINLALVARAHAFMSGRAFVTPKDVKDLAKDVLRHRILLSYEAEAEDVSSDQVIDRILSSVPVP